MNMVSEDDEIPDPIKIFILDSAFDEDAGKYEGTWKRYLCRLGFGHHYHVHGNGACQAYTCRRCYRVAHVGEYL